MLDENYLCLVNLFQHVTEVTTSALLFLPPKLSRKGLVSQNGSVWLGPDGCCDFQPRWWQIPGHGLVIWNSWITSQLDHKSALRVSGPGFKPRKGLLASSRRTVQEAMSGVPVSSSGELTIGTWSLHVHAELEARGDG